MPNGSVHKRDRNSIIQGSFLTSNNIIGANVASFTIGNSLSLSLTGSLPGDFTLALWCVGNNATGLSFPAGWNLAFTLPVTNGSVGGTIYLLTRVLQGGDTDPVFSRVSGTGNIIGTLQSFRNMREPGILSITSVQNQPDALQYLIPNQVNRYFNARSLILAIKSAPDVVGWASLSNTAPNYLFGGSSWNEGAESGSQWAAYLIYGQVQTQSASGLLVNRGGAAGVYSVAQIIFA